MVSRRDRRLLDRFHALPEAQQATMLEFLDYLYDRYAGQKEHEPPTYVPIERPESESVVGAMQRLRKSYPMLNMDDLLHRASALMSEHVVGGRGAGDVIDELEELFRERHEARGAGRPDNRD